jgi:hypothetical protein
MWRDGSIGKLDLAGRFGAFVSGKGHAHHFDFLSAKATTES